MAKDIKFNIRLNIDGKQVVVTCKKDVRALGEALTGVSTKARSADVALSRLASVSTLLRNGMSGFQQLGSAMQPFINKANAATEAQTKLTTVMRQRMSATDADVAAINKMVGAQTQLGIVGGTVQRSGLQQLATFSSQRDTLETLLPAMNNLLAQQKGLNATSEDAVGVANLMGKALMGNVGALTRVCITLTDQQKELIKTGNEYTRAKTLAQAITDNVGEMNQRLAETDAGHVKQMANEFGSLQVKVGKFFSEYQGVISGFGQLGMAVAAVGTLGSAIRGLVVSTGMAGVATRTFQSVLSGMRSFVAASRIALVEMSVAEQLEGKSALAAAVSTTAFKMAIRGLLIATGVGAAIALLTVGVEALTNHLTAAKASTDQLAAAEESAQALKQQEAKQIAEVTAALDINIAKLKEFKGSKEEEKRLVGEMNSTYGEAMGYYSTVAQWYTALTGNSKAYCNQMVNEIRLRNLASQAADLQQQQHNIRYDDNGKLKKYSKRRETRRVATGQIDAGDGKVLPQYSEVEVKGTSDLEKANARLSALGKQEQALRKQMGDIVKGSGANTFNHYAGYSPSAPSETVKAPKVKTSGGKGSGSADTERKAAEGSLDWYEQEMQKLRKQIYATNNEQTAQGLQAQYDDLEQKSKSLKVSIGLEDPDAKEVKTYVEQLQEKLAAAQKDMDNATTVEARVSASAKVDEIQAEIDKATKGEVSIQADVEPSYMVKGSVADKRQSYSNAQSKGSTVQSDFEIGIIGKDEAERQIAEINKEIAALGANMKPIKLQVDDKLDVA